MEQHWSWTSEDWGLIFVTYMEDGGKVAGKVRGIILNADVN